MELIIFIIFMLIAISNAKKKAEGTSTGKRNRINGLKISDILANIILDDRNDQISQGISDIENAFSNMKSRFRKEGKKEDAAAYQEKGQELLKRIENGYGGKSYAESRSDHMMFGNRAAYEKTVADQTADHNETANQKDRLEAKRKEKDRLEAKGKEKDKIKKEASSLHADKNLKDNFRVEEYLDPLTSSFYPDVTDYLSPTTAAFYSGADEFTFSLQNPVDMIQ